MTMMITDSNDVTHCDEHISTKPRCILATSSVFLYGVQRMPDRLSILELASRKEKHERLTVVYMETMTTTGDGLHDL